MLLYSSSVSARCNELSQQSPVITRSLPHLLFSDTNFIGALQIETEVWTGTKSMSEADSCIIANSALARDNLTNPIWQHANLTRECYQCRTAFV